MARNIDSIADRLCVLEQLISHPPRTHGPKLGDLPHFPLIARYVAELQPLIGSASWADQQRIYDLSQYLYALLQLDGWFETSDTGLAGLLDSISVSEPESDQEFWAAFGR